MELKTGYQHPSLAIRMSATQFISKSKDSDRCRTKGRSRNYNHPSLLRRTNPNPDTFTRHSCYIMTELNYLKASDGRVSKLGIICAFSIQK